MIRQIKLPSLLQSILQRFFASNRLCLNHWESLFLESEVLIISCCMSLFEGYDFFIKKSFKVFSWWKLMFLSFIIDPCLLFKNHFFIWTFVMFVCEAKKIISSDEGNLFLLSWSHFLSTICSLIEIKRWDLCFPFEAWTDPF